VSAASGAISILRRLGIIVAIGVVFLFGLATTVYLSLRSPEVRVPEVIGKDRFEAERILGDAGLNFRVRATRPSNQSKPDTVLFQLPRANEMVKVGQTVAMDISRAAKEGEAAESAEIDNKVAEEQAVSNANASPANENKPKRKNKNANENANGNTNTANRNANANRADNANTRNANAGENTNSNRAVESGAPNSNSNTKPREERRPAAPKPSPAARNTNTNP
jgi:beta-lactam-binding protein with PASTA domain